MIGSDFEARLKAQVDFPSPSQVASEIVALARNPDIEMGKVAQAVSRDPAITAKILRIANSAFYAQRKPAQNLRQALMVIGLNAALTLALSFSLVSAMRTFKPAGIDYMRFWRRTLLAATAARAFAEVSRTGHEDDLFLAALLQDIAVLAIDRTKRDFYSKLAPEAGHKQWIDYERKHLGQDHAAFSATLLKFWNLPARICKCVEYSHAPRKLQHAGEEGRWAACVGLASDLAEAVLNTERMKALKDAAATAHELLGLSNEQFTAVVTRVLTLIPEAERLYDASIITTEDAEALLAEARELLAIRNLRALQEVSALQATTSVLLSRTEQLEDASRRDSLTGAFNRAWLDSVLEREFTQATLLGRSLSLVYIDIDHFKVVNERFGVPVGDRVLRTCAQTLQTYVRGSDIVARFGGEEFVVLLPDTDGDIARQIAQRLLQGLTSASHETESGPIQISASIGLAICTAQHRFENAAALLEAADHALYAAKLCGRNRVECFQDLAVGKAATQRAS